MSSALDRLDLSALPGPLAAQVRAALLAESRARVTAEAQAEELAAQARDLADYAARLEYLIKEMRRALYGRKSEKLSPNQLSLAGLVKT